jgi:hypothetical protein
MVLTAIRRTFAEPMMRTRLTRDSTSLRWMALLSLLAVDHPGICPGDDWQLMSRQGKPGRRGETGERGMRGEKGDKGERGQDAPTIVSWQLDRERYRASPLMSNGTVGPMLELRGLFEQFLSCPSSVIQNLGTITERPAIHTECYFVSTIYAMCWRMVF